MFEMSTTGSKERRIITDFIELYHDFPCLWNTTIEAYRDKTERNMAWELLADKLKELEPRANVATAKKKVEHMRTAYRREYRKVFYSKRRQSSKVHVPSLWYYNLLSFIKPKNETYESKNNSCDDNSDDETSKKPVRFDPHKNTKRKRDSDFTFDTSKKKLIKAVQEVLHAAKNPPNPFGVYVGEQLLQVDSFQRQVAEKLISDVIFFAKMGKLDFESTVKTTHSKCNVEPEDIKPPVLPEVILPCSTETSRSTSPAQYIRLSPTPEPNPPESSQKIKSTPKNTPDEVAIQSSSNKKVRSPSETPNTLSQVFLCSPSTKIVQTSATIKKIRLSSASQKLHPCPVKISKADHCAKIVLPSSALKKIRLSARQGSQPSTSKIIWSSRTKQTESQNSVKRLRSSSQPKSVESCSNSEDIGVVSGNSYTSKLKEMLSKNPSDV